jgi:hypothetical protein
MHSIGKKNPIRAHLDVALQHVRHEAEIVPRSCAAQEKTDSARRRSPSGKRLRTKTHPPKTVWRSIT